MITRLHEVDPLRAHQLPWQLSLDGIDHAGVGDAQAAEELVGLEDLERIKKHKSHWGYGWEICSARMVFVQAI